MGKHFDLCIGLHFGFHVLHFGLHFGVHLGLHFDTHFKNHRLFFAYLQLAHMLRVKTVVLWPFFERLKSDAHVILFVVYPKQKTLVCFDSLIGDGKSATSLRVLVLNIIRNVLQLSSTNDWTDYNITWPQQNGKNAMSPY
jgi:hypothetical protein